MDGPVLGSFLSSGTWPKLYSSSDFTLQDKGPVPTSLYGTRIWNENTGGSVNGYLNAVLFTFSGSNLGFGAWFGDVETRSDGEGLTAMAYVYDDNLDLLDSVDIVPTVPVADQFDCGGDTFQTSEWMCGNATTRWIGYKGNSVKHMLVVVGDDDDVLDGGSNDGKSEHLSFVGPTVVLLCEDSDGDGICDDADDCPDDEIKRDENNIGCGCNIIEPINRKEECVGTIENDCAEAGIGTIQCDGSCNAVIPVLPSYLGESCIEKDVCGKEYIGELDCEESCEVFVPLPVDTDEDTIASCIDICPQDLYMTATGGPDDFGSTCESAPNNCGTTVSGTIGCDSTCTAKIPDDLVDCSCPAPVATFGEACSSPTNTCGTVSTGTVLCDGTCSAEIPADPNGLGNACFSSSNICGENLEGEIQCDGTCSSSVPDLPVGYGTTCTSEANNCGTIGTGTIGCDGLCNATVPTDLVDCTCSNPVENFGEVCSSGENTCGKSEMGTVLCDGTCSVTVPSVRSDLGDTCVSESNICGEKVEGVVQCDGSCSGVTPNNPENYGESCTSEANICGAKNTGTIGCDGICAATIPNLPEMYGTTCTSGSNTCGMVNTGTISCDETCSALIPSDDECPDLDIIPVSQGGGGGSNTSSRRDVSLFIPRDDYTRTEIVSIQSVDINEQTDNADVQKITDLDGNPIEEITMRIINMRDTDSFDQLLDAGAGPISLDNIGTPIYEEVTSLSPGSSNIILPLFLPQTGSNVGCILE